MKRATPSEFKTNVTSHPQYGETVLEPNTNKLHLKTA